MPQSITVRYFKLKVWLGHTGTLLGLVLRLEAVDISPIIKLAESRARNTVNYFYVGSLRGLPEVACTAFYTIHISITKY